MSDCTVTMHGILCYSTMRSEVNVSEVTETQLIHYHPEKDLLPMILANSNYSFKYREGSNVGYDFASIQSELEDRFFSAKSRINTATVNIYLRIEVYLFVSHTCEPVASKMLEKFTGELAKKRENFVGLRYVKNVGK